MSCKQEIGSSNSAAIALPCFLMQDLTGARDHRSTMLEFDDERAQKRKHLSLNISPQGEEQKSLQTTNVEH
jgi:hypothetical protein